MVKGPLPDPQWSQSASICIACGYSLEGLPRVGQCPECGSGYEDFQLVLFGVPRSSHASGPRRIFWAVLITLCVTHLYTLSIQVTYRPWIALVFSLVLVACVIALLVTGPRERRGTERFIVAKGGIARVAMKFDPASRRLDTIFVPWGTADTVNIERISTFWKRLTIGNLASGLHGPMRNAIFDAGFRCPDADVERVREAIPRSMLGPTASAQSRPVILPPGAANPP